MPLPKANKKNESKQEFISRCAGDSVMNREFPNKQKRLAVCFDIWRRRNKTKAEGEEIKWEPPNDEGFLLI